MKQGERYISKEDIKNVFGDLIFEKDKAYIVLYVDNDTRPVQMASLNHRLYSNEYSEFPVDWILKHFTKQ